MLTVSAILVGSLQWIFFRHFTRLRQLDSHDCDHSCSDPCHVPTMPQWRHSKCLHAIVLRRGLAELSDQFKSTISYELLYKLTELWFELGPRLFVVIILHLFTRLETPIRNTHHIATFKHEGHTTFANLLWD